MAVESRSHQEVIREVLEDIFTNGVSYNWVKDAVVQINGTVYAMEDALRDNLINHEDLFTAAGKDARARICQEVCDRNHGLPQFTYRYPDFEIFLVYDIFKTPDGQEHLICDLGFFAPGAVWGPYTAYADQETLER